MLLEALSRSRSFCAELFDRLFRSGQYYALAIIAAIRQDFLPGRDFPSVALWGLAAFSLSFFLSPFLSLSLSLSLSPYQGISEEAIVSLQRTSRASLDPGSRKGLRQNVFQNAFSDSSDADHYEAGQRRENE